jgi:hypothetical protein
MSQTDKDFLDAYAEADEGDTPEVDESEVETEPSEAETGEKEQAEVSPTEEEDEEKPVPYKAMKAERTKRQEREKRIAELEAALEKANKAAPQAQPERHQAPPEPEKTFWEDPDAFINSRVSRAEQANQVRFLVAIEDQMREAHPDYDEVIEKVKAYGQQNPAALHQVMTAPNPAKAGYQLGKKLIEHEQMQDPEKYREKLRAEILAELEAEQGKASEKANKAAAVPPDLSSARSVAGKGVVKEPDPFKELFPRK